MAEDISVENLIAGNCGRGSGHKDDFHSRGGESIISGGKYEEGGGIYNLCTLTPRLWGVLVKAPVVSRDVTKHFSSSLEVGGLEG